MHDSTASFTDIAEQPAIGIRLAFASHASDLDVPGDAFVHLEADGMTKTTSPVKITGIDITAYLIKDTERALAFYRDVLGLAPDAGTESADGAEYTLGDGATFGIWNPGASMPWHPSAGVMFAVEDIEGAVRHARSLGATFEDVQESPVCWMSVGEDSEGNSIVLHKRK